MNRTQDPMPKVTGRLRDAFQAAADIVQPDVVAQFSVRDAAQARSRWRALAPLAAAVAVVAVVAGSVAAVRVLTAARSHGAALVGPGQSARDGIPPFYVTWAPLGLGQEPPVLGINSSATGALLSQVEPPRQGDNVMAVAGVAASSTFVIAVGREGSCQTWLYEMRLTAAGRLAGYTPLGVPMLPEAVYSLSVSPDTGTIAYAGQYCSGRRADDVGVINVADQQVRRWIAPGPEIISSMSLSGDGSLLTYLATPSPGNLKVRFLPLTGDAPRSLAGQVDLLSTSSPAGSLPGHSRVLVRAASLRPRGLIGEVWITPDGTGLIFSADPVHPSPDAGGAVLWLFSVRAKTIAKVIPVPSAWQLGISADPLGHDLLLQHNDAGYGSVRIGRFDLATRKFTPLRAQGLSPGPTAVW